MEKGQNIQKQLDQVNVQDSELGNCMSDFEEIKQLGRGSYGTVDLVKALKGPRANMLYV
jgi:hypothetical protein